jgi:hypothetical protein
VLVGEKGMIYAGAALANDKTPRTDRGRKTLRRPAG